MRRLFALLALLIVPACGGGPGDPDPAPLNDWTWVGGTKDPGSPTVYGTLGVANPANTPGGRQGSMGWTGADGSLWVFGGSDYIGVAPVNTWGDLWRWNAGKWTWVAGPNTANPSGVYGTKGVAAAANHPGARIRGISRSSDTGTFWLFGGSGYDSAGTNQLLNDLWEWDGVAWTWVSGASVIQQAGVYGVKGTPAAANMPGSRDVAMSWSVGSELWVFGGSGFGATLAPGNGFLKDLWRWDGTNWTWISGDGVINSLGVFGTKGVASAANMPGGRQGGMAWKDHRGNLWVFGGVGYDSTNAFGNLNDLWRWDGTDWTWMSGSTLKNQAGVYGTQGVADAANTPGARDQGAAWTDAAGNLWLLGGNGYDGAGTFTTLNDLWKFDGTQWTWVSGAQFGSRYGIYGTLGVPDPANYIGSHSTGVTFQRTDDSVFFWGGFGAGDGSPAGFGNLNDLWRHRP